jgi:hypothetical protein
MAAKLKIEKRGSYVKLSSAVAAILVEGLKCWTHFWKGTTQGSFQQNLVEIGSVVSEENIFLKISSSFLAAVTRKIEMSSIVHCCFSISQSELKF